MPFIVWISDQFAASAGINKTCLKAHSQEHYSHDNVFHSVLGLMEVDSVSYNPDLDVFAPCNRYAFKRIARNRPVLQPATAAARL